LYQRTRLRGGEDRRVGQGWGNGTVFLSDGPAGPGCTPVHGLRYARPAPIAAPRYRTLKVKPHPPGFWKTPTERRVRPSATARGTSWPWPAVGKSALITVALPHRRRPARRPAVRRGGRSPSRRPRPEADHPEDRQGDFLPVSPLHPFPRGLDSSCLFGLTLLPQDPHETGEYHGGTGCCFALSRPKPQATVPGVRTRA